MGLFAIGHKKKMRELWEVTRDPVAKSNVIKIHPKNTPPDDIVIDAARNACFTALRQVEDSTRICETTTNPETFYSRLEFLRDRLQFLQRVEKVDGKFLKGSPTAILKKLDKTAEKSEAAMWARYFSRCIEAAGKKKTVAAQQKIFARYFYNASQFDIGAKAKGVIEKNLSTAQKKYDYTGGLYS